MSRPRRSSSRRLSKMFGSVGIQGDIHYVIHSMYGTVETVNELFSGFCRAREPLSGNNKSVNKPASSSLGEGPLPTQYAGRPGACLFCHPELVEGSLTISALGTQAMRLPRGGIRDPSTGSG